VGLGGEVVALDGQREMLETLKRRLNAEDITNVRPLLASLAKERFGRVVSTGSFSRWCSARGATAAQRRASSMRSSGPAVSSP
jgi:hypothetical protein